MQAADHNLGVYSSTVVVQVILNGKRRTRMDSSGPVVYVVTGETKAVFNDKYMKHQAMMGLKQAQCIYQSGFHDVCAILRLIFMNIFLTNQVQGIYCSQLNIALVTLFYNCQPGGVKLRTNLWLNFLRSSLEKAKTVFNGRCIRDQTDIYETLLAPGDVRK